jgi:hypothetical protein
MRKYLFVAAALVVSCGLLLSCLPLGGGMDLVSGEDLVKPPVVLQLTVANNADAPISVRIRHRYKKGWSSIEGEISNSDWAEYAIPAGAASCWAMKPLSVWKTG